MPRSRYDNDRRVREFNRYQFDVKVGHDWWSVTENSGEWWAAPPAFSVGHIQTGRAEGRPGPFESADAAIAAIIGDPQ